jgi:gamma-glutamylputrescine oxidase
MAPPVRIKSYYAASAHAAPDRAELDSSVDCDVCVVGDGIAGCSTALHLTEAGYKVVLLDEYRVGWGASGRSGAQAIHSAWTAKILPWHFWLNTQAIGVHSRRAAD